jgi:aryl-alcohol dehydrogenase-like predicted oxidoreductase
MNNEHAGRLQPRRPLGRTGFAATILGIGDLADRAVPIEQCIATIHRAMDRGLNVIDTAPMYEDGYSEQIVGAALQHRREGMFLIDKIDHFDRPVGVQADASLQRLGLDHVDLFVLHGLSSLEDWRRAAGDGGAFTRLDDLVSQGKCRFRGISSHDPKTLQAALESGRCDVVMFPVGPYVDQRYVNDVLPLARRLGVGTVCFKSFGAGKLLADTEGYNRPLQQRPRGKRSSGGEAGHDPGAAPMLPCMSVAECLGYTLTCDPDVALLGMSFPNEVDAALDAAAGFRPLGQAAMAEMRLRAVRSIEGKGECWWNPREA